MMKFRSVVRKAVASYKKYKDDKITKVKRNKSLCKNITRSYGRNNSGRITVRHKFSGTKKVYRKISFAREILDVEGTVQSIEYDPNRTAFIALIEYVDKRVEYILATEDMKVGDTVIASMNKVPLSPGNATCIKNLPQGTVVSNVEFTPGLGGKIARSAGGFCDLIDIVGKFAIIKLSSGFMIKVNGNCFASIGIISNVNANNKPMYKAGQSYYKGIRPTVRGVAMNPVDHPHGGGEGKTGTKRHPVTYTCKLAKGIKTRSKRSINNRFIIKRKK